MKAYYSKLFLCSKKNGSSTESDSSISKRNVRRKLIQFSRKHKLVMVYIVAGLTLASIIIFYPPAKKLLISVLNSLKYKLYNPSSFKDPDSTELANKEIKSKRGRALALLIALVGIGATLLTRGKSGSQSVPIKTQPEVDTTEVPFSRAMRDNVIMVGVMCFLVLLECFK